MKREAGKPAEEQRAASSLNSSPPAGDPRDFDLAPYEDDCCALLLPDGPGWQTAHMRRTYSARNVVRSRGEVELSVALYPRSRAGGAYADGADFLARTQRLPGDIVIERETRPRRCWRTGYTDRRRDRYYVLIEGPAALLEIDCTGPCGGATPPIEAIVAAARFHAPPATAAPPWESLAIADLSLDVPVGWARKDEYNRPLDTTRERQTQGLSVARADAVYATRQLSPPQYRIQRLEPGRNLHAYLVGLKTERHKSSMDGAMYQFLGEDTVRGKHARGARLRYQGYSPRGIRGPLEWYHELLLLEVRDLPLLITAYCDWIERDIYRPVFARITASFAPR